MTESDGQLPLFDATVAATALRKRRRQNVDTVHYTKYKPRRRTLCNDCVRDIHERGIALAPYPGVVSWRRVSADGVIDLLCDRHKRGRTGDET